MVSSYLFGTLKIRKEVGKMKKAGFLLVGALVIGGMITTSMVMAAGNGNAGNGNGVQGTSGICQMDGQQQQMGKGQGKVATLANNGAVKADQTGAKATKGNGTPGTPGNCQMANQQGQMGKGQAKMAQTIATLANKPVDEVLNAKQPGEAWLQVAEKYGVKQEQIQQENMKQRPQNGGNCNGPYQNGTNNGQTK